MTSACIDIQHFPTAPQFVVRVGNREHSICRAAVAALTLAPAPRQGRGRTITADTPPWLRTITADTQPWFLNNVLMPKVVESPDPKRLPQNYGFFESFVKYQR